LKKTPTRKGGKVIRNSKKDDQVFFGAVKKIARKGGKQRFGTLMVSEEEHGDRGMKKRRGRRTE